MNSVNQLELSIERPFEPDRNHRIGGRSFYFFDLDDNVFTLPTPLCVFHKFTGQELTLTTQEFALISEKIGKRAPWEEYEVRQCPETGSFRKFRHHPFSLMKFLRGRKQPIIEDLHRALSQADDTWKGPSWKFFWHAVHNGRPISIITARGHEPRTIQQSISILKRRNHLTKLPNYLSVYPVNHKKTRKLLGDPEMKWSTAVCKKEAIRQSVYQAFKKYGFNSGHRFGMSDDDPKNLELIIDAMAELKVEFPDNSFYVIDTHGGRLVKQEIQAQVSVKTTEIRDPIQLDLL